MAAYNSCKKIVAHTLENNFLYTRPYDIHVHIGCQVKSFCGNKASINSLPAWVW